MGEGVRIAHRSDNCGGREPRNPGIVINRRARSANPCPIRVLDGRNIGVAASILQTSGVGAWRTHWGRR